MTYFELKVQLDTFTPEQLACEVVWTGDERGCKVKCVWIAQEDWVENDGDCEPRSVLDASERDGATVIIPKGTPQLVVD